MSPATTGSQPVHGVTMRFDVPVPTRDGVKLSTDIYLPDTPGSFPALLVRTPYDNSEQRYVDEGRFYSSRGYAYVVQDCRGRYDSEGVFYAWFDEAKDGYDSQEWVGQQPWCDGNVAMYGSSFMGATQ